MNQEPSVQRVGPPIKGTDGSAGNSARQQTSAENRRRDLLHRHTPTPYGVVLRVMGKTIRLETNSPRVVESALGFFGRHQGRLAGHAEFLWRIVSQKDQQIDEAGVALSAFSDHGLRFANIGQKSFLAVDLKAREGIGFVAERLIEREPTLHCRSVFDTLFCMTAASLGLVPLSAACVGVGNKGLLIFGPPNSGKTTASYLAAKLGLEFHADHAVFLEMEAGRLQAWGDLLPAIFRTESLQFLPELRTSTRRFSYPGLTVHYLPKGPFQAAKAQPVSPVCSVFLNRASSCETRLTPMLSSELSCRFANCILFKDDDLFQQQTSMVLHVLRDVPAYDLAYGRDPGIAATCLQQILADHDIAGIDSSGRLGH